MESPARPVHIPPTSDPNTDSIQISDFIDLSLELKREYASHYDLPNASQLSSDEICALLGENSWIPALKRHVWVPRTDLQGVTVSNNINDLHKWNMDWIVRIIQAGPVKFRPILDSTEVSRLLRQQWGEAQEMEESQADMSGKGKGKGKGKAVLKEKDASDQPVTQQLQVDNAGAASSSAADPITVQLLLAVGRKRIEFFAQAEAARANVLGDIIKKEQNRINRGDQDPVPSASTSALQTMAENRFEEPAQASQAVMLPVSSTSSRAVATKNKTRQSQKRALDPERKAHAREDIFAADRENIPKLMAMIKHCLEAPPKGDAVERTEKKPTGRRRRPSARRKDRPTQIVHAGPSTLSHDEDYGSPFSRTPVFNFLQLASEKISEFDDHPFDENDPHDKEYEDFLAQKKTATERLERTPSVDIGAYFKALKEAEQEDQDRIAAINAAALEEDAIDDTAENDETSDRVQSPEPQFIPSADEDATAPPSSEEMVYLACVLRGKPLERTYAMLDVLEGENQHGAFSAFFEGFKLMFTAPSRAFAAGTQAVVASIQSVFGFGRSTLKRTRADEDDDVIPELGATDPVEAATEEEDYAMPRRKRVRFEGPESGPSMPDSSSRDLASSPTVVGGSSSPVGTYTVNGVSSSGGSMSSVSPMSAYADEVQRTPSASRDYVADEPSTPTPARRFRARNATPASRRFPRRSNRLNN